MDREHIDTKTLMLIAETIVEASCLKVHEDQETKMLRGLLIYTIQALSRRNGPLYTIETLTDAVNLIDKAYNRKQEPDQ